jgi:cation transport ATPase
MDCREEVALIETRFKSLRGLEDFSADVIGQRLHVKYDAARLSAAAIAAAVADAGMRAWLEHEAPAQTGQSRSEREPGSDCGGKLLAAVLWRTISTAGRGRPLLFAVSIAAGVHSARSVAGAQSPVARHHNTMLIAAAGAGVPANGMRPQRSSFCLPWRRCSSAPLNARLAAGVMDLPAEALVRDADGERKVRSILRPGGSSIKPSENPLDGTVIAGCGPVNQAPITGDRFKSTSTGRRGLCGTTAERLDVG